MRILVVNVNTTESITETIAQQARAVAAPGTALGWRRGAAGHARRLSRVRSSPGWDQAGARQCADD